MIVSQLIGKTPMVYLITNVEQRGLITPKKTRELGGFLCFSATMGRSVLLFSIFVFLALLSVSVVKAEDAYKYFTWTVTYEITSPLGVAQQVWLNILYAF
ncbi:unnamed protein product [Camellia sinensis]